MARQVLVCRILATLAVLVLGGLPGEAQTGAELPPALPSGVRLRVTIADETGRVGQTRLIGRLTGMGSEGLRMAVDSSERTIPRGSVVRLERSVRPSRKGRAALIGFGVGFAAMYGVLAFGTEGDCFRGGENLGFCAGWSALLALPAAAVGAMVAPGEQWAEVRLHDAVAAPRSSSAGLQLRVVPVVGRRVGLAVVGSF
jgi:hypothetical protein